MRAPGFGSWLDGLKQDLRFALRSLGKSPAFVAVAVLCLALGIGANAAIFSVVNAVLLRPLPYAQPERLVRLYETQPGRGASWTGSVSWPNYRDWVEQTRSFEQLVAVDVRSKNLSGPDGAERVPTTAATGNLFALAGVQPLLGRTFLPGEDAPGAAPVAVLGEGLWRRRFGADPGVLGRSITLDGTSVTVVGVMPATFRFLPTSDAELFVPFVPSEQVATSRGSHGLAVVGRLRPAVSLEAANTELREVARRIEQANPDAQTGRSASAVSLTRTVVQGVQPALLVLLGAVFLVLLIACANVANLLLARGAGRQHEVAVRLALGASRGHIVRQLLVESLVLSLGGALLGVLLAHWGLDALASLAERALPRTGGIGLDGGVMAFLLVLSVASALLFGLAPALQSSRADLRASLSDGSGKATASGGHKRFRSALVVAELALSLVLLVGAGLLVRGFVALLNTDPGLHPEGVLTAHLALPQDRYKEGEAGPRLLAPVLERTRALPGVQGAALISMLPIQSAWTNGSYTIVGEAPPQAGQEPIAEYRGTSPGFFATLGIPLLAGRDFTEADGVKGAVMPVIVNEALARRHFGGQEAIGKQLRVGDTLAQVVGVVGNVHQAGLHLAPLAEIHIPYNHPELSGWLNDMTLVVKSALPPDSLAASLRQVVRSVDADQPLYQVQTMQEVIERSVANRRLTLLLLGSFAVIALVLAAAGLYGVISYLVAQRTRELGIRMALGAQAGDVVRLVMRQGAGLTLWGIGLGIAGALALSRLVESLVYGVSARDPVTFAGLALVLAGISLLASWLPARRAARVDPVLAIKAE
ncbi:ABC transporter permease [Aggregicoccus sp. 17bor-14]|uniref:ABC transporter permease n=1 Tax=Myxococcaceae TaxID=31 RepID=UPI00129C2D30|nr:MULTISPECIES: ABC transporter permease [Myxococcaceae]MBF5045176.1 ABC transporter permease [Simulacricoccus sp. 17bor-14]MRI90917.1 ABC transporter permease [Aggregicoccus sp. 17bor-14]